MPRRIESETPVSDISEEDFDEEQGWEVDTDNSGSEDTSCLSSNLVFLEKPWTESLDELLADAASSPGKQWQIEDAYHLLVEVAETLDGYGFLDKSFMQKPTWIVQVAKELDNMEFEMVTANEDGHMWGIDCSLFQRSRKRVYRGWLWAFAGLIEHMVRSHVDDEIGRYGGSGCGILFPVSTDHAQTEAGSDAGGSSSDRPMSSLSLEACIRNTTPVANTKVPGNAEDSSGHQGAAQPGDRPQASETAAIPAGASIDDKNDVKIVQDYCCRLKQLSTSTRLVAERLQALKARARKLEEDEEKDLEAEKNQTILAEKCVGELEARKQKREDQMEKELEFNKTQTRLEEERISALESRRRKRKADHESELALLESKRRRLEEELALP